jgi:hypothetical protein
VILKDNIYSHTTGKLYGAIYEPVMIIAQHDNVLIVEGVKGRFPVPVDMVVSDESFAVEKPTEIIRQKPPAKNKPAKKQQTIVNQLFKNYE